MSRNVITRFAPSPTGDFHVGGARTALFNWLWAKANGGQFILRIEDTDQKRFDSESANSIIDGMKWLGLDWDYGPNKADIESLGADVSHAKTGPSESYLQSRRLEKYKQAAFSLVEKELAYPIMSDGYLNIAKWRDAPNMLKRRLMESGRPYHIRLKLPREGVIVCKDHLRGDIIFRWDRQKDTVILKTDGFPTYHLASVVDDIDMQISHVIRNEEWISSMPIHIYLYQVMETPPPVFVHTASIKNPNGRGKLSKRSLDNDKHSVPTKVMDYVNIALPSAMINFMALLGWSPKTDSVSSVLSVDDIKRLFNISGISTKPSAWDFKKLLHINNSHFRQMDTNSVQDLIYKRGLA